MMVHSAATEVQFHMNRLAMTSPPLLLLACAAPPSASGSRPPASMVPASSSPPERERSRRLRREPPGGGAVDVDLRNDCIVTAPRGVDGKVVMRARTKC